MVDGRYAIMTTMPNMYKDISIYDADDGWHIQTPKSSLLIDDIWLLIDYEYKSCTEEQSKEHQTPPLPRTLYVLYI